jgi:hypothetical protein
MTFGHSKLSFRSTGERQWSELLPLSSARLVLRRFTSRDVEAFLAYRNDPVVARFQSWQSCSPDQAEAFVARQELQQIGEPGQWLQIGIVLKQKIRLLGSCSSASACAARRIIARVSGSKVVGQMSMSTLSWVRNGRNGLR